MWKYQLTQALSHSSTVARARCQGKEPKASSAPAGAGREGVQWGEGIVLKDNGTSHPFSSWQQGYRSSHSKRTDKAWLLWELATSRWIPGMGLWGHRLTPKFRHKLEPIQELTNITNNIYYSCVFSAPTGTVPDTWHSSSSTLTHLQGKDPFLINFLYWSIIYTMDYNH